MLNRKYFYILKEFAENDGAFQNFDNITADELIQLGYIDDDYKITDVGLKALEPYRVKRAIFMAAGFGSRMVPVTLDTPRPLVKVNGVRIIDRLIDPIYKAGIDEIVIVREYLKEKFDVLKEKHPIINFVDNDANNIYSLSTF